MTDLNTHSEAGKKPYRQPEFRVFGTIAHLTEAIDEAASTDNNSSEPRMTRS